MRIMFLNGGKIEYTRLKQSIKFNFIIESVRLVIIISEPDKKNSSNSIIPPHYIFSFRNSIYTNKWNMDGLSDIKKSVSMHNIESDCVLYDQTSILLYLVRLCKFLIQKLKENSNYRFYNYRFKHE